MKNLHSTLLVCVACLFLISTPNTAFSETSSKQKQFTFTAIPDQDERHLVSRFSKVASYLSHKLNIDVKYVPVKSYAAAITAFRNNEVQLAWFGGLSGVHARRLSPGSSAIAQGYEDQFFKSYFIAHSSTGLEASDSFPANISDKTFVFGSKGSTSGRLMPEYYIRQHLNQSPDSVFQRVGFSGDHSKTIELVQSGVYQIGVVNYKVWDSKVASGDIDPDKVRVIWETPVYHDYQWTIRGDVNSQFGENFNTKVQQALINMNDPALLSSFPRSKFIATDNDNYTAILNTAKAIGLIDPS